MFCYSRALLLDTKVDFDVLFCQYQIDSYSGNDTDKIDIKYEVSYINDDNCIFVHNSADNMNQLTNIFDSLQNTNDLCNVDSNM